MKARTVAEVVAAEAGGKTRKDRLSAMKDVFSAMFNRATLTGKPLRDVVSIKSQFNAYNSIMPEGTPSLVGLAQQAINDVLENGPTHKGTYYARSYATKNLPKGLTKVKSAVDDHIYYSDPKNRAIETAKGAIRPTRENLPAAKQSLQREVSVTPQSRPNTLAAAAAPSRTRSMFDQAAQGTRFTSNFPSRPSTVAPNTLGRPTTVARSFTPTGPMNTDIYSPVGGYRPTTVTPGQFNPDAGFVDPMNPSITAARDEYQRLGLPSHPEMPSFDQQMADRQTWQDEAKARKSAESVVTKAQDFASTVGDTIGGFFDSLSGPQTATASTPPNDTIGKMLSGMDNPVTAPEAPTATYADVMAGRPVKTTTVAAYPDDPRMMAYKEDMAPPLDIAPPEVVPQTLARTVRKPLELTVRAPRRQVTVAPSMPGGTLGGITAGDRYSVGTGLQGITSAMGGPRGATGFSRSNPGVSVTSRGPNLGTITRNERYGTTTFRDTNGNVTGTHFDGGFGARLGGVLGGIFGGGSSSSGSGKSSGSTSSGKSSGGHVGVGGGTGRSQHEL